MLNRTAAAALALLPLAVFFGVDWDLPIRPPHLPKIKIAGEDDEPEVIDETVGEDPPDIPPPVIFGEALEGVTSIVYVIDQSGSMGAGTGVFVDLLGRTVTTGSRFDRARTEVVKSIQGLDESYKYEVEMFDCAQVFCHKPGIGELLQATQGQKSKDSAWVMQRAAWGGTGTGQAVVRAVFLEPDAIVLITDGAPGCTSFGVDFDRHTSLILSVNTKPIPIHVWGIGLTSNTRRWCQSIAATSGGMFREID